MGEITFKGFCAKYWHEIVMAFCSFLLMGIYWYLMSIKPVPKMWYTAGIFILMINIFISLLFVPKKTDEERYNLYALAWGVVSVVWMYVEIYWGITLKKIGRLQELDEFMLIAIVIFVTLFVIVFGIQLQKDERILYRQETKPEEELKVSFLRFPWKSNIAEKVGDFVETRLVYEDGYETKELTDEHGKFVGYRISPTLVVSFYWFSDEFGRGLLMYGNFDHVLTNKESDVLKKHLSEVNDLRGKRGLPPIKL